MPSIAVGPGIKAGAVSRTQAVGYDLLPTVCDLAGVPSGPKAVEGGTLKPVLLGVAELYQIPKRSTPDTTILSDGWKLHYGWETARCSCYTLTTTWASRPTWPRGSRPGRRG